MSQPPSAPSPSARTLRAVLRLANDQLLAKSQMAFTLYRTEVKPSHILLDSITFLEGLVRWFEDSIAAAEKNEENPRIGKTPNEETSK